MWKRSAAILGLLVIVSACSRAVVGANQEDQTTRHAPAGQTVQGLPDLPVDPTLNPVSLSHLSADAKAALAVCVRPDDLDKVAGMAELPASEVHRFMLTNGKEPELQSDALVWAVQLKGHFPSRVSADLVDPLCVVVTGIPYRYGPYGDVSGQFVAPADFVGPDAALPPLQP